MQRQGQAARLPFVAFSIRSISGRNDSIAQNKKNHNKPLHYQGNIIRPPSEADSIILQTTVGCSHNRCTFCGAYRDPEQKFQIKDNNILEQDIAFAAQYCRRQKTVFFADGDALVIPQQRLLNLFSRIREKLPWVRRINLYANCRDILNRVPQHSWPS